MVKIEAEVKRRIQQKAVSLDDLNNFMAKIVETDMSEQEFERINYEKSYVPIEQINVALDEAFKNCVLIDKNKLQQQLKDAEKEMSAWKKGGDTWYQVAYRRGYFILKELLKGEG